MKDKLEPIQTAQRRRIEAQARPGESWERAPARLREEDQRQPREAAAARPPQAPPVPSTCKPPSGDEQPDFLAPALYDVGTRDSRSVTDAAVFRLPKKDRRAGEVIRYELPDGHVQVSAGPAGMASVWDYDLVLMAVSHL